MLDTDGETVTVAPRHTLTVVRGKADPKIKSEVRLPCFVTAPISEGDVLGTVLFTDGEGYAESVELLAKTRVSKKERKKFFGLF